MKVLGQCANTALCLHHLQVPLLEFDPDFRNEVLVVTFRRTHCEPRIVLRLRLDGK
eukprot:SAG11_NODE_1486_length_4819_cov_1.894280_4_plen_56_part_00